jgi:hypothetical protein
MSCSQCGNANAEAAAYSPACVAPLSGTETGGNTSQATAPPAFRFDARRWTRSDPVAGAATLVLFTSLFMPWFGVTSGFAGITVSVNGLWHGYMYIALFAALAILVYLIARAGLQTLPFRLPSAGSEVFLATVASVNLLLVLISFLARPEITTGQAGAYAGLIAAIVAAAAPAGSAILARANR